MSVRTGALVEDEASHRNACGFPLVARNPPTTMPSSLIPRVLKARRGGVNVGGGPIPSSSRSVKSPIGVISMMRYRRLVAWARSASMMVEPKHANAVSRATCVKTNRAGRAVHGRLRKEDHARHLTTGRKRRREHS